MTDTTYVPASPGVRALADRLGVALASVRPTGAGGRIRKADVYASAGVPAPPRAPATTRPATQASAFAANPLVDRARSEGTAGAGPAPTLFPTGNLPPWTASGIDPNELLQVPAAARHALANAPTRGEALSILAAYQGAGAAAAAGNDFRYVDGNLDYEGRVQKWQASASNTQQPPSRSTEVNPWLPNDGFSSSQPFTDASGG